MEEIATQVADAATSRGLVAGISTLLIGVVRLEPLSYANVQFAAFAAEHLALKNSRELRLIDLKEGIVPEWLADKFLDERIVTRHVSELLLADEKLEQHVDRASLGLIAGCGCALTGLLPHPRRLNLNASRAIVERLHRMGFQVDDLVVHADDPSAHLHCHPLYNYDLFVALVEHPSIRLGHQIAGVTALLTPVIVAAPSSVSLSCLVTSVESGRFYEVRYRNRGEIVDLIEQRVTELMPLLHEHAAMRGARDVWHRRSYEELRSAVHEELEQSDARGIASPLVSRSQAAYVISSLDAYAATSVTLINFLRVRLGLAPLGDPTMSPETFADLLDDIQRAEFAAVAEALPIPVDARNEVIARAVKNLVGAGSGRTQRTKRYTSPQDWIGEYSAYQRDEARRRRG